MLPTRWTCSGKVSVITFLPWSAWSSVVECLPPSADPRDLACGPVSGRAVDAGHVQYAPDIERQLLFYDSRIVTRRNSRATPLVDSLCRRPAVISAATPRRYAANRPARWSFASTAITATYRKPDSSYWTEWLKGCQFITRAGRNAAKQFGQGFRPSNSAKPPQNIRRCRSKPGHECTSCPPCRQRTDAGRPRGVRNRQCCARPASPSDS